VSEIVMVDVVGCPECGGFFGECAVEGDTLPNIVQHCVEEHPASLIATAVRLYNENQT